MNPALGPFSIAAMLLVVGGLAKVLRPRDTANALSGAGVPVRDAVVRIGAALEVSVGIAALAVGGVVLALLVAASYAAFAVFVTIALVRHLPIASCGCFGKADAPPSLIHLGVDVAALLAAAAILFDPGRSPLGAIVDELPEGLLFLLLVAIGTAAALLALMALPRLTEMVRSPVGELR